jgi:hypothetical protein
MPALVRREDGPVWRQSAGAKAPQLTPPAAAEGIFNLLGL